MGKLTVKKVEALTEPGRYSDEDGTGFHLRVDAEGRKYYILRTHVGGKRKDITIGSAKRLTLAVAREKARNVRERIEKDGAVGEDLPTFAEAAKLTHQSRTVGYRNTKHVAQWLTTLETYVNPLIGDKPVSDVTRADVVSVLAPIWTSKAETARRVLQRIDRVMRWAVGNNFRSDRLDMLLVRDALPKQPRKRTSVRHMPSIPWREAPEFMNEMAANASIPAVRLALTLLILTAVRPGNVRVAKRSQIDLATKIWLIPADEMKGGEPHRVPLSDDAINVVKAAASIHDHDLLFTLSGAPMSLDTLRMSMRRMGRTETPHGFRSTFKEWARAAGWADHLSEAALSHQDANAVRAAYARHDLLEERAPMMAAWAAFLAGRLQIDEATPPAPVSGDHASRP